MPEPSEEFTLYDLRVEVVDGRGEMVCNHTIGDYFELSGENLSLPAGQTFTIYALAALLPLLPAKQRKTHQNDWMTTDTDIACPDPHCGAIFRITRTGERVFRHSDVSAVSSRPLPPVDPADPVDPVDPSRPNVRSKLAARADCRKRSADRAGRRGE